MTRTRHCSRRACRSARVQQMAACGRLLHSGPGARPEGGDVSEPAPSKDWEDVRSYTLDDDNEASCCAGRPSAPSSGPARRATRWASIVNFIFRDGRFWLTATDQRPRIASLRRDPRVSVAVTSKGAGIGVSRSLTYKGICVLHDDAETRAWFVPGLRGRDAPGRPREGRSASRPTSTPPGGWCSRSCRRSGSATTRAKMWKAAPGTGPRTAAGVVPRQAAPPASRPLDDLRAPGRRVIRGAAGSSRR